MSSSPSPSPAHSDDLVSKIVQASSLEKSGEIEQAIALYQEVLELDKEGNYSAVAQQALANLQSSSASTDTTTKAESDASWWGKLSLRWKVTGLAIALSTVPLIGIGVTAYYIAANSILVAEDSVATRRMLEKVLTAVGYQVLVCRDGQEALDQLQQHQETVDLILSDVEMPKVNGFELLKKVRAHPLFHSTPVVMATSRTGDRHREQAMKLGATDYLGKPIQPQELIDTVAALLVKS